MSEQEELLKAAVTKVAASLGADIVLFNSDISDDSAAKLDSLLRSIKSPRESVFLILVTYGGDIHAAYRIGRELQLRYKKVGLCIAGDCYSAGTLIVLSGNEVIVSDRGNLGPLDVQVLKRDELRERISGLAVEMSINELNESVAKAVVQTVTELKTAFGPQLTFRTALDVAANITSHTFGEIYKQIDPIRIGEDARALRIASHYGYILGRKSGNLKPDTVERLQENYPSHECIIDREEARELFNVVREPNKDELALIEQLSSLATEAIAGPLVVVLEESSSSEEGSDEQATIEESVESKDNNEREKNESGDTATVAGDDGKSAQARGR